MADQQRQGGKQIPPRGYTAEDVEARRRWLEERTGAALPEFHLDAPEELEGLVENQVGYVGLPLAVAGPLTLRGSHACGQFQVPLCTLEGTLSLSMTRGMLAAHLSGGIETQHIKQELPRSPIFVFEELGDAGRFREWVQENLEPIRAAAEATTRHGKLLRIDQHPIHNRVILDFVYSTGDAAGQNMVTLATHAACQFIEERFRGERGYRWLIECNLAGDKSPTHRNLLLGRGHHVIASCRVKGSVVRRLLHTTTDEMIAGFADINIGSRLGGVSGLNLHVANALAAIYLATGQDVACVAENAVGVCSGEKVGDDLLASLSMPSITVGTVGGATRLHQQSANLELLGCRGEGSAKKFAEIICAAALALELSLAGAIVSNEFADAHARFGRRGE
ncbi:MAG: hydroxymethylglutaryl-CoA reductase [Planctomycetota bacterium]|nr:MAG: hydroxymethylglutaryl-CoA reductase [Planctomycetota bacterium]